MENGSEDISEIVSIFDLSTGGDTQASPIGFLHFGSCRIVSISTGIVVEKPTFPIRTLGRVNRSLGSSVSIQGAMRNMLPGGS